MTTWKMPTWMEPYRSLVTEGHNMNWHGSIESIMTMEEAGELNCVEDCHNKLIIVAKIDLLTRLHESGLLIPTEGR